METSKDSYDVIIIGGGPAGCSTAVFTSRYELDTLILDRGKSSIKQCAFIENYLGFPGGIDVTTFYEMIQTHVKRVGGTIISDMATDIEKTDEVFYVESSESEYKAKRVVAASTYDVSYLESILLEHFKSEDGETYLDSDVAGERGKTTVEGLWLAGPIADVESQIAIAVGHGARVGLDVVTDYRIDFEGLWEDAANYTDWVVTQGRYEGKDWLEKVADYYANSAPEELDVDSVRRTSKELAKQQQNWQISDEEVERRTERSHRRLLDHIDDELILEYANELKADGKNESKCD